MTNEDNFEVNDGEVALEEEQQQPIKKKSKTFSAKEFRKHLKGENIRERKLVFVMYSYVDFPNQKF